MGGVDVEGVGPSGVVSVHPATRAMRARPRARRILPSILPGAGPRRKALRLDPRGSTAGTSGWNACDGGKTGCPLTPGRYYVGGVPDTFTYYVSFRATVPVTVWIMTTRSFVCWETRQCAWQEGAVGWEPTTLLRNGIFEDAEGCAGYLAVFLSDRPGTLYPNVEIERNPAPRPTGACR